MEQELVDYYGFLVKLDSKPFCIVDREVTKFRESEFTHVSELPNSLVKKCQGTELNKKM
jgi:hypothetical protein